MLSPLGISRCEAVLFPTSTIIRTRNSAIDNSAAFTDFNAYGSPPYIGRVFFSFSFSFGPRNAVLRRVQAGRDQNFFHDEVSGRRYNSIVSRALSCSLLGSS